MSPPIYYALLNTYHIMCEQALETAYWADSDEETGVLCRSIEQEIPTLIEDALKNHHIVAMLPKVDLSDFAHDLYLTARGHGVGFWDGDWDNTLSQLEINYLVEWCSDTGLEFL